MTWRMVLLVVGIAAAADAAAGQSGTLPIAVDVLDLDPLAGDWYEVATFGSWPHRRCVADTRLRWVVKDDRTIEVRRSCTTASGEEIRDGRLRARQASHPGRLSERVAPAILTWLPAAWSDYWVLAVGDERAWLLVGDRRRARLSVLSRWVALDEASLATAVGAARAQGFDVDRLTTVRHASGSPPAR